MIPRLHLSQSIPIILLLLISSTQAFSYIDFVQNSDFYASRNPAAQLRCYALPYGGIGILHHLLTTYAFWRLSWGLRPLLCGHITAPWYSLVIATVSLFGNLFLTISNVVRCHRAWPVALLAVSEMLFTAVLAIGAIHAMLISRHVRMPVRPAGVPNAQLTTYRLDVRDEEMKFAPILDWLMLYFVGFVLGFIGICRLLDNYHVRAGRLDKLMIVTTVIMAILFFISAGLRIGKSTWKRFVAGTMLLWMFYGGLWSMTVMSFLTADKSASGSNISSWNQLMYWVYFGTSKLVFLMW